MMNEERLNQFEMYAKRDGGLHGVLALELVDEVRRLRKELEKKRRRKWFLIFGRESGQKVKES